MALSWVSVFRGSALITRPDLILLGATGRNAGTTRFACELIKRYAASRAVTALKVTTISASEDECPRGGRGCGICASVDGRFAITEETKFRGHKATSRMLQAGAQRVLWLRVHQEHLAEGVQALLERVPAGGILVCTSTSAREVLEPGLFLLFQPEGPQEAKASAQALRPLADRVVTCSGAAWDLAPSACRWHQGRWSAPLRATAVILAGGQSRRMGRDKSLLQVGGQPLIARIADQLTPHFTEVLVSSDEPEKYRFLGLPVIPDDAPGQGPLMGILSCLKAAREEKVLVVACDVPVVDLAFARHLLRLAEGVDLVMPVAANGHHEPLFAVYGRSLIPRAQAALAEGRRKVADLLPGLAVAEPAMPAGWYWNLNTEDDFQAYCELHNCS